jgi:hypothetical protein
MKLHYRVDRNVGEHTHVSIFINERLLGHLCMSFAESVLFDHILARGCGAVSADKKFVADYFTSRLGSEEVKNP